MTEEEFCREQQRDQFLEKLSNSYYKTPGSIKQSLLSVMTDSDIAIIIWDKRKEWWWIEWEKKVMMKWLRWDNRKIVELLFLDEQEKINKLVKNLQFTLRWRSSDSWSKFTAEDLQKAKDSIPIHDVIEVTTGIRFRDTFRLIKCPFPAHKDNTPSMKVYKNTNTFYCQWCKKWWSQVDFIFNVTECTVSEAIYKFLTFYKK